MRAKQAILLLASFAVLTACSSKPSPANTNAEKGAAGSSVDNSADLAFGKYTEPVTLKIGYELPNESGKLAQGDTYEDNPWSRYFQSKTNIKVVHNWQAKAAGDAFKQKVNLSIASNDLPDAVVVDRQQLQTLIDNDMLADLTDAYQKYASPLVKQLYDSSKGLALKDATFGGKLMGLPNTANEADNPTLVWVRQDWLDKLKLPAPKTLDDIEAIAKAFIEQDPDGNGKPDTAGIPGDKVVVWGGKPNTNGFDSVFGAYHSFPKNWLKDAQGTISYGSIAPETKEALAKLADWYKKGIIDAEFALRKEGNELITGNKVGIFFAPWHAPYGPLRDSVKNDMTAEWRAYAAPLDSNGKFVTHMAPVTDRYIVVKKGYKNPEAVVRLLNQFTQYERVDLYKANVGSTTDPDLLAMKTYKDANNLQPRNYYPFDLLLDYADTIQRSYKAVMDVVEGKGQEDQLEPQYLSGYRNIMIDRANPKKNLDAWVSAAGRQYGAKVIVETPMEKVYSEFYGTTPTMDSKWPVLEKLENETFLKIIIGSAPLSSFDKFVQQWKQLGGDMITKEIQKAVDSK